MKDKVMDALQRFSKAMFIPVLILPIAGILIAVGNLFTNVRLQAVLPFLNNPVTIGFGTLLSGSLNAILGNLGVIFCVGLSVGLANKKKSEAGFISLLAFLVFLNAMNKFMNMPYRNKVFFTCKHWPNEDENFVIIRQFPKYNYMMASYEPFGKTKYIDITSKLNQL